jgi:tetratricopeptide (TPR) repeat protein
MGLIHEAYGQTAEALLAFEMAAAVMPWADEEAVRQVGLVGGRRPVWLAQERSYVTGSLAAWLDLAFQELRAAADAATRGHWRGQALAASQRCLFRDLTTSENLRSRWLAPLAVDDPVWSGAELDLARRLLTADGAEDPEILANLGRLELLAGRHEQAVMTLERAQDLGFRTPLASTHLAIALAAVGREDEARGHLDRALVIDPELTEAWYNRGVLSLHQGAAAAALADLERAADLAPENPEVREALQGARQLAAESATP